MKSTNSIIITENISGEKDGAKQSPGRKWLPGEKSHPHRAYLLRCWREGEALAGQEPFWRFSLEEVVPERRRKGFSSLEALLAFLRAELAGEGEEQK
jgi:hypothetical protein